MMKYNKNLKSSSINNNANKNKYSAQQLTYEWVDVGMIKQRWIDRIHEYYKVVIN